MATSDAAKALPAERTRSPSLSEGKSQADSWYVLFWNLAVLPQAHDSRRYLEQACVPMRTIEARRKSLAVQPRAGLKFCAPVANNYPFADVPEADAHVKNYR